MGLAIEGPKAFTRAFPKWFDALSVRAHRTGRSRNGQESCACSGRDERIEALIAGGQDSVPHADWRAAYMPLVK